MRGWTTRELAIVAVFGSLWGVAEMSLGSALHALQVPLTGTWMAGVAMVIALTGRVFVPRRGAVLGVAIVAALLKAFSIGSVLLGPMLAIALEGLCAELALALAGSLPRRPALAFAGALGVAWTVPHPFLTQGLLGGQHVFAVYQRTAAAAMRVLGLDAGSVAWVLTAWIGLHLGIGMAAGLSAWALGRQLASRLQARPA